LTETLLGLSYTRGSVPNVAVLLPAPILSTISNKPAVHQEPLNPQVLICSRAPPQHGTEEWTLLLLAFKTPTVYSTIASDGGTAEQMVVICHQVLTLSWFQREYAECY
jgi:hypothetical protein